MAEDAEILLQFVLDRPGMMDVESIQKALLTGKWVEDNKDDSVSPIANIAKKVTEGAFRTALTAPEARNLFIIPPQENLLDRTLDEWFTFTNPLHDLSADEELLRLALAVACLHAFVQVNWTGPNLDVNPLDTITAPQEYSQDIIEENLQKKSVAELSYGGEPAYHLAQNLIYLRLSKLLLDIPYKHCRSASWWGLRTWLVHQQVLDEPTAVPSHVLTSVEPLLHDFAIDSDLAGRLILEQGLLEHHLGHDKSAAEYFVRAARTTHLQYELTGALGKRTRFQQTDVTQLVLLAESRERDNVLDGDHNTSSPDPTAPPADGDPANASMPETLALNDDTLLERTEYTSSSGSAGGKLGHLDPSSQPALHPLDQCIILALCLNVRNTSPSHGLTAEQMTPYIARVISHPRNWSIHTMALLLRSRLEANRTRTVERSTLQLQALVDQMPTADSTVTERLLYFHSIPLPSKWEMERELAARFLSIGVVKSALEIFERLEMWEEVVKCWQSMERRDKGVTIVRDLLEGRKAESEAVISKQRATAETRRQLLDAAREAKLWCLLGDLEPDNALNHYTRAWTVSKETSGRAMRSLGGYYFARGDYPNTINCLRRAVAINPLLARSWFVLGCAYVRMDDWEGAREAFTRCVTIDDEDGESWNNLASVYLRLGEAGKKIEAFEGKDEDLQRQTNELAILDETSRHIPFSNRMLAFRALKQGLKFAYENWRMWSNYMIVAMDVGELSEACRALARVVEERSAKDGVGCVDEDVLERLVDAVTRAPANPEDAVENGGSAVNVITNPNEGHGLLRRVTDLFERTILPRVSSPRIFRARARLLSWQGQWQEAIDAYLDGYRCSSAGTEKGETDVGRWREAVGEVEEIVDVFRNFGPRVEGYKWKLQARSIIRTFMGRTKDFEDEPEWSRLTELQEEIKKEE